MPEVFIYESEVLDESDEGFNREERDKTYAENKNSSSFLSGFNSNASDFISSVTDIFSK